MTAVDQARTTLDLGKLKLPDKPKIENLRVEEYIDQSGEEALRILLILSEDTSLDDLSGESVSDIKLAIHDALLDVGVRVFPYISFAKQSELDQLGEGNGGV